MKKYILFIDSGVGGLSTLSITLLKNNANYIYFADNKFAPYGNKSEKFLRLRLRLLISKILKKYEISMIVLACNTATTNCISYLRQSFPGLQFIGTEPAIKSTYSHNYKQTAIIATPQTIRLLRLKNLSNFNLIPCPTLASSVENFSLNPNYTNRFNLLKRLYIIKKITSNNDCLILGCTHYSIIYNLISSIINKPIFDGNQGVANRISSLADKIQEKSMVKIILARKNYKELQKYKKILNQILANQINLC